MTAGSHRLAMSSRGAKLNREQKLNRGVRRGARRKAPGMDNREVNNCTGQVVDAAMRVHSALGPGVLESAYEACLAHELRKRGLRVAVQVPIPIIYDTVRLEIGYRADLVIDDAVIVELKAVSKLMLIHEAQLLSYLD
jgi:GxxExxY protein